MRIVAEMTDLPVPKVLYYDDSCTVCASPYFFMEKLKGSSLYSIQGQLLEKEKRQIQIAVGQLNRKLNAITEEKFGYLGRPDMQGKHWCDVFQQMLRMSIKDAEAMSIDLKISVSELWRSIDGGRLSNLPTKSGIFRGIRNERFIRARI